MEAPEHKQNPPPTAGRGPDVHLKYRCDDCAKKGQ